MSNLISIQQVAVEILNVSYRMQDLDAMFNAGLYINDLSMHDFSRDLMLAGTQQSVELKLALDQVKSNGFMLLD